MLVKGGARHTIATGNIGHLDLPRFHGQFRGSSYQVRPAPA
jgi:hypothetical protein